MLVHSHTSIVLLVLLAVVMGIPQGLVNLAVQNSLFYQADPVHIGASSGLLRTFMYLGAMLAAAASGAFFGPRVTTAGLHDLGAFTLAAAALFRLITVLDRSLTRVDRAAARK